MSSWNGVDLIFWGRAPKIYSLRLMKENLHRFL